MSISIHCFNTFEKSLLDLRWWKAEATPQELELVSVASTAKLSESLRFSLSYAVCVVAGVEHFVAQARQQVLAQLPQSAAFAFVELVSKHEAAKALLFEGIVTGSTHQLCASVPMVDSLLAEVGGFFLSPQWAPLMNEPYSVEFYQDRFVKLARLVKQDLGSDIQKEILRTVAVTI